MMDGTDWITAKRQQREEKKTSNRERRTRKENMNKDTNKGRRKSFGRLTRQKEKGRLTGRVADKSDGVVGDRAAEAGAAVSVR